MSFFCAYYFDNKSVLTIAITGLAAYVGLSVTPQDLLNNINFHQDQTLSYSAIPLGVLLILWTIYSKRIQLQTNFSIIYFTFALHIIVHIVHILLHIIWISATCYGVRHV